jgi:hypothetical protein
MIKQQPPRFVVRYEDSQRFQQALAKVGGNLELLDPDDYADQRETTSLIGARSIQRSLERRGHLVQGIYERVGIREVESEHSNEYCELHPDEIEWEWDREEEVTA